MKEWLEKRAGKAAEKKEKADKPVDVEAQAKRLEARHKKVLNGVDDLQGWLKDLVRSGLLNVQRGAIPVCRDFQANGRCTGSRFGGDDAAVTGDSLFRRGLEVRADSRSESGVSCVGKL